MAYDNGNGTFGLYRWTSTGSGFTAYPPIQSASFYLTNVGDRMAASTLNGDGPDDIVMAYQNSTGSFTYHVWSSAQTYAGAWYTSSTFSLSRVAGRLAADLW